MNFTHLHVHTHYSLLDGLPSVPKLLDKVKELGMTACAITDHGVMYGVIEFYKEAKKRDIKPILGSEVYIAPRSYKDKTPKIDSNPFHLVLLCKNLKGYKNLIKLITIAHLEGFYYKPRIDKELLKKHSDGLIALSGCLQGEIPRHLIASNFDLAKQVTKEYLDIFGKENFYLELQDHPNIPEQHLVNKGLLKLAKDLGVRLVATCDVHYLKLEDREAQEVLLCLQTGKYLDDKDRMTMIQGNFSLRSEEEMINSFKEVPEAIENTQLITNECNLELELGKFMFPKFDLPEGVTNTTYLRKLCYQGLKTRYKNKEVDKEKIVKRLEYELTVIEKCGFEDYFLIIADVVNWAKKKGILVGPGRGSAAGSLVSYCLGITDVDPIKYNLIFERFLNPERIAPPDIDVDFADDRRKEVISYVISKYGAEKVAQIITFGTMAARNAVRDTGRVLGMSYTDVDKIAKLIPPNLPLKETIATIPEVKELYLKDPQVKRLLDLASKLEGVARHASTHAAGVVISPLPLVEFVPLQKAAGGDTSIVTQFQMEDLEAIGLLKMDFLGLANLTILQNTLKIIKKVKNIDVNLKEIPLDDKKTFKLLSEGETTGVFQLESDGMRRYLRELKPTCFEDIISMVALYRPGPMDHIKDFIACKHGKKKAVYLHPKLKPILEPTYGVLVTQDQVLEIARSFAGFSYAEADVLRKAVGKKIPSLLMEQKMKFIEKAKAQGVSEEIALKVWDFIEPFAGYGFNRAHATCYATIAYQTAYLKAHYPACFMAALLTSDMNDLDKIAFEIKECQRLSIKVLPPDINRSFVDFSVDPQTFDIRFALSAIKNIGQGVVEEIVKIRKKDGSFKSLEDFLERTSNLMNKKILESLIKSGSLDCFGFDRNKLLLNLENLLQFARDSKRLKDSSQLNIFAEISSEPPSLNLEEATPVSKKIKLMWEKEYLGIYLSEHPLEEYKNWLEKNTLAISKINEEFTEKRVRIAGVITEIKRILTRSQETMLFVKIEDLEDSIELIVFPKLYERTKQLWTEGKSILTEGIVSFKEEEPKILCEKVELLQPNLIQEAPFIPSSENKLLYLTIPSNLNLKLLEKMKGIIAKFPGEYQLILSISENGISKKIKTSFKVAYTPDFKRSIKELLGNQVLIEAKKE